MVTQPKFVAPSVWSLACGLVVCTTLLSCSTTTRDADSDDTEPEVELDAGDDQTTDEDEDEQTGAQRDASTTRPTGSDARAATRDSQVAATDAAVVVRDAELARADASVDAQVVAAEVPASLSAAGVTSLFPASGATEVCPDPPLRIGFARPPALGKSGKIQVFDAAQPSRPVASVDLAVATIREQRGSMMFSAARPAYVDDNEAVFYLPTGSLVYGHKYFVRIDEGVLDGVKLADDSTWTFEVADAAPRDLAKLNVGYDGKGDFCSLQSALDAVEGAGVIEIARGKYHGIVYFAGTQGLTIRGADRKGTVLLGTNNERMNGGTARRALVGGDGNRELTIENLTIHNLTPQGGMQAEALRLQTCDRCTIRDADILSLQDTLLWSGRLYAENCLIAGNVDFIWGTGTAYFERCEIKTVGRTGYIVQARNDASHYGYVFVDSKLTSDPNISGTVLARIDSSVYPSSQMALIDCELGSHIDPKGWLVTGGGTSSLRFGEYGSKSASGAAIDVSRRAPGSKQLSAQEAATLRDPSKVLGGWMP